MILLYFFTIPQILKYKYNISRFLFKASPGFREGRGARGRAAARPRRCSRRRRGARPGARRPSARPPRGTFVERFDIEPFSDFSAKWANFIGLVLFCVDAKFYKKIFVGKLLTRSTRFTCFCTAQTSIFQKHFVKLFRIFPNIFRQNFAKLFTHFRKMCIEFCSEFDEILSEFRK